MKDPSFHPISDSTYETAETENSSHDQSSYLPPSLVASRLLSKEPFSVASSANPSRESSPIRPTRPYYKKTQSTRSSGPGPGTRLNRSKKNNTQNIGSVKSINLVSAATTQRISSASTTPALQNISPEQTQRSPLSQNFTVAHDVKEFSRWPIPPRLRSPPPNVQPLLPTRKLDVELSSKSLMIIYSMDEEENAIVDSDPDEILHLSGMRTPARGVSGTSSTLETVQEISRPGTPISPSEREIEKLEVTIVGRATDIESLDGTDPPCIIKHKASTSANESGNESSGKGEMKFRAISTGLPGAIRSCGTSTKSFISTGIGRVKPSGEAFSRNMTVETETVSSVSQISVGLGGSGNVGSIRTKPSSETIRPKKEKKKIVRKPPSITSGTASSKSDIFEAKVASAVDEANSSDSEETFVYESNPPDSNDRPCRFHSRTPSAASMASQVDQRSVLRASIDGNKSVMVKRSMKFANSYSSVGLDTVTSDNIGKVTVRSNPGTGRGTPQYHHVNVRWGRHAGKSHPSLFDNESTFPVANSSKMLESKLSPLSRPTSPKDTSKMTTNAGENNLSGESDYNLDDSVNERTSLLLTIRARKSKRSRHHSERFAQLEHHSSKPILSRCGGCLAFCIFIILVISAAAGFVFATSQPLTNVKILALENIIASEQVLAFNMKVQANNANLVAVNIESTDLVVIAKSKYSTDPQYIRTARYSRSLRRGLTNRNHHTNMPFIQEIPTSGLSLEIGRVYTLDNPLNFEGSPFSITPSTSVGQISILAPGNDTYPRGTDTWKNLLMHDFNIILRGKLWYNLPLNRKMRSITVEFRGLVEPDFPENP